MGNIFNHVVVSTDGGGKPRTFKGWRNNKQMNRTHSRWLGSYLAILASKPVPSIWDVMCLQENHGDFVSYLELGICELNGKTH